MTKRLLYLVNNPDFFIRQHSAVARHAAANGFEVHVAAPGLVGDDEFVWHEIAMNRGAVRPRLELASIRSIRKLIHAVKPDVVHNITLKPILYGSIASLGQPNLPVINSNTGLGFIFIDDSLKTRLTRVAMGAGFALSLAHRNRFDLFLNQDDRAEFISRGMARRASSRVVPGPGIDLAEYPFASDPHGPVTFVLPSRMLWHKGVREFVDAASILKGKNIRCRCLLVGDTDAGNLAAIPPRTLLGWHEQGVVEWMGHQDDMPSVYRNAHVVVLPSYREGMGRVLQEGASMGRALIATDVAGCREVVESGINGFLVRKGDAQSLANAMEILVSNRELRQRMGAMGRKLAERKWSIDHVAEQTLTVYQHALGVRPSRSAAQTRTVQ